MSQQLHIALLQLYEATPESIDHIRRRTAFLGKYLVKAGHRVTWIKNAFDHAERQFAHTPGKYPFAENFDIIHVKGIGYKKNICIRRYIDDYVVSLRAIKELKKLGPVDGIVCSTPSVALAFMACRYAKKQSIPFILDIRDAWPDAFPYAIKNKWLRRLIEMAIIPERKMLVNCIKNATSIVAMSKDMLNWGLGKYPAASQKPTSVFYLSTTPKISLTAEQERVFAGKYQYLLTRDHFRIFYISSWGRFYQPSLLIDLAKFLIGKPIGKPIDFIICGDGDFGTNIRQKSNGIENVFLPGFLSHEEAYFLSKHCHCAFTFVTQEASEHNQLIAPSFPNKAFFLFATGLPIINGMTGELSSVIDAYKMGLNFDRNDLPLMADCLKTLLNDETLRQEMANNVKKFFDTQADPAVTYTQYASFVKTVILEHQKQHSSP